ncbi:hypothetical protein RQP46_000325 [Phenoliferia psychrophenolica]
MLLALIRNLILVYLLLVAIEFLINLEQKYANKKSGIKRGVPKRRASLWFRRPTWAELGETEVIPGLFHLKPRDSRARSPILPNATPIWSTTPVKPRTYSINGIQLPPPGHITNSGHLQPFLAAAEIAQVEALRAHEAGKSEAQLLNEARARDERYRKKWGDIDSAQECGLERIALDLPASEDLKVIVQEDSNLVAVAEIETTPSSPVQPLETFVEEYSNASTSASDVVEIESPLAQPVPATHLNYTPFLPFVAEHSHPTISESDWIYNKLLVLNGAAPPSHRTDPSSWPLNGCNGTYYSSPSLFPTDWMVPKHQPHVQSFDASIAPAPSPPPTYSVAFPSFFAHPTPMECDVAVPEPSPIDCDIPVHEPSPMDCDVPVYEPSPMDCDVPVYEPSAMDCDAPAYEPFENLHGYASPSFAPSPPPSYTPYFTSFTPLSSPTFPILLSPPASSNTAPSQSMTKRKRVPKAPSTPPPAPANKHKPKPKKL